MSAVTDPIADYLTRIRNAQMANKRMLAIPSSKMKKKITEILYDQGYILRYKFEDEAGPQGEIKIALKYDPENGLPVIREMKRYSTPGLRRFSGANEFPRVKNGLGIAIISTSKGVMTSKQATSLNVGGEVLCTIF